MMGDKTREVGRSTVLKASSKQKSGHFSNSYGNLFIMGSEEKSNIPLCSRKISLATIMSCRMSWRCSDQTFYKHDIYSSYSYKVSYFPNYTVEKNKVF